MANEISLKDYLAKIEAGTLEGEITQDAKDLLVQAMHSSLDTSADNAPEDTGYLKQSLVNAKQNLELTDEPGLFKVRSVVEVYDDKEKGKNQTSGFAYGIYQDTNHKSKSNFLRKGRDSALNVLAKIKDIQIIKLKK